MSFVHPFENVLSTNMEDIEFSFRQNNNLPWADFLLNPRRLRGSDFLMRWSQGEWSEERITKAVNGTREFVAFPYGPSGVAPDDDVRKFELYFERLEQAGLGGIKRPDLLVFKQENKESIEKLISDLGGFQELPFTKEENPKMKEIIEKAVVAVECENSLWKALKMPDYALPLKLQKKTGLLGIKKSAVAPTIIIKEEDREPLKVWQRKNKKSIHVWHLFYDLAFGISLDNIEKLIGTGQVPPKNQIFQAPGGATTTKVIYKINYQFGYPLAKTTDEPKLVADCITDKNGHILPYVKFSGGDVKLMDEALAVLRSL